MSEQLQTIIFFVRHGDTDVVYSPDPLIDNKRVLTDHGRAQLKKVGEYLKSFDPAIIYYSPRLRTIQSAESLQQAIANDCPTEEAEELYEIYGQDAYRASAQAMPAFLANLVKKHAGEQIVLVSHMDTIQGAIEALGASRDEADFPCQTAEGYRLVFAGDVFVECQKIRPADEV